MRLGQRTMASFSLAALMATGLAVTGADGPAGAAITPLWTCTMPVTTPPPTATASPTATATTTATASVSPSASPSPTPSSTPPPGPVTFTPLIQIAGNHNEIDETGTLFTIQLKSPNGTCLSGPVTLREEIGTTWRTYAVVNVRNGSGRIWVSARVGTLWRAYSPASTTRNAAWSVHFALHNIPPKPRVVTPSWLTRPSSLPAQQRAAGVGPHAVVQTIPDAVWNQMNRVSWHPGCPVGRSSLRLITINYWGFDGYRHRGELVVVAWAVHDFVGAFNALYAASVPIRSMRRVDAFGYSTVTNGGDDYASMKHDNTSAFNCRWVDGSPGVRSPHSWGAAVDLNPYENPYHSATGWTPNAQWAGVRIAPYAWRALQDKVVAIMRAHGFSWTYGVNDSQHFDAH